MIDQRIYGAAYRGGGGFKAGLTFGRGVTSPEARRAGRLAAAVRRIAPSLDWSVVRVNDDGRREVVNDRMCYAAAEKVAGALRDASTDNEVAEGWNYLPQKIRTARPTAGAPAPQARTCRGPRPSP